MRTEQSNGQLDRVRRHTDPAVLRKIDEEIEQSVRFYATQPPEAITRRIEELDREWDMERRLGTNAATIALGSALLGLAVNRKFLLLTCTVMGFLLQHSVQGWCPPVPIFRKLGVRTRSEIDREKFALKALRGDFEKLPAVPERMDDTVAPAILQAVNA